MARRARHLVQEIIASAREAGTAAAYDARGRIAEWLREQGYEVATNSFQFNADMYRAFPGAALMLCSTTIGVTLLLVAPAASWAALAVMLAGLVAAVLVAWYLMRRPLRAGDLRSDANLVAFHPGRLPDRWLVAHLDTKAQGQSMAGRLIGIWVIGAMTLVLLGLCAWRLRGPLPLWAAAIALIAGGLASWFARMGRLAGSSPGACDNGSGLLAVLAAVETRSTDAPGVIITSGEEFALAGARALSREFPHFFAGRTVINVDTVDDEGRLYILRHRDADVALAERLAGQLGEFGVATIRRVPRGILVDSQPLSRVAGEAVTISRLSWNTLRRVHTAGDNMADFRLEAAERLGKVLADAI